MLAMPIFCLILAIYLGANPAWASMQVQLLDQGFSLKLEASEVKLSPVIQVGKDTWTNAQKCSWLARPNEGVMQEPQRAPRQIICQMGDFGSLSIDFKPRFLVGLRFTANRAMELRGIGLSGDGHIEGARAFLSNGIQSWSQSSVLALSQTPSDEMIAYLAKDLSRREEMRSGEHISFDASFISGSSNSLIAGSVGATTFRTWLQMSKNGQEDSKVVVKIMSGGLNDQIELQAGESFCNDDYYLQLSAKLEQDLIQYAQQITSRVRSTGKNPSIGWNSWYEHFSEVNAHDIRSNSALLDYFLNRRYAYHKIKAPRPIVYIDDGWQIDWGEWQSNDKFPEGLEQLVKEIDAQNFDAGIWIAPLLVRTNLSLIKQHPEWFLKETYYQHPSGRYAILDVTHPDAAKKLAADIAGLVGKGFKHIKADFLIAGLEPAPRHLSTVTSLQSYQLALRIIRQAAGEETTILGSGAPTLASLPYVDSWRIGPDIALEMPAKYRGPSWVDIANQARNISARWFFCHATNCDADPLLLRGPRLRRYESMAWIAALVGGGLFLSDNLPNLPRDKWDYALTEPSLRQSLSDQPAMPMPMVPEKPVKSMESPNFLGRIFDRQFLPVPNDWLLPNGKKLVINFESKAISAGEEKIYPRESRLF